MDKRFGMVVEEKFEDKVVDIIKESEDISGICGLN